MIDPTVSVVVPVRDGAATLSACLDALAAQVGVDRFEVVVVDDGSRDATATVALEHPLRPTVVHSPGGGSYDARNRGVQTSSGAVLAFTDADCAPEPGWLRGLLDALARGAAMAAGPVVPLRSPAPTLWERWDVGAYLDQESFVAHGFAATANLATRREVFDRAGPFDARLRSSGDLEWTLRAGEAGADLVFAPGAAVRHHPRTTLRQTWRLHRRLGAGWRALHRMRLRDWEWFRFQLFLPLGWVAQRVCETGPRVRRRQLVGVHALVLTARWTGWLTGR